MIAINLSHKSKKKPNSTLKSLDPIKKPRLLYLSNDVNNLIPLLSFR